MEFAETEHAQHLAEQINGLSANQIAEVLFTMPEAKLSAVINGLVDLVTFGEFLPEQVDVS